MDALTMDHRSPHPDLAQSSALLQRALLIAATIFDADWYGRLHGLDGLGKPELFIHYTCQGMFGDLSPHRLFDARHYREQANLPDATPALLHYAANPSTGTGDPHPLFDAAHYLDQAPDLDDGADDPLSHFLRAGGQNGLNPHRLFDVAHYLAENAVRLERGQDPITHFLMVGAARGCSTSPCFDLPWYCAMYADRLPPGINPLVHYVTVGHRTGFNPNRAFDCEAYRRLNGITSSDVDPLCHFLEEPWGAGRQLPAGVVFSAGAGFSVLSTRAERLGRHPLVSIVVCNRNGAHHLADLFDSLARQTYRNHEIVFVDDASTDASLHVAGLQPGIRIVRLAEQSGFATANNEGLKASRGEVVALLNNDTRVDENWLEGLVLRMRDDPTVGAVAPKIRFWTKFTRIRIEAPAPFAVDGGVLLEKLSYRKYVLKQGDRKDGVIVAVQHAPGGFRVELDLPLCQDVIEVPIPDIPKGLAIAIDGVKSVSRVVYRRETPQAVEVRLGENGIFRSGFHIINNAGSVTQDDGMPADRGIFEVDAPPYDEPVEVPYLCGCSALVRRSALNGRPLFIDELGFYYEDSELSHRIRTSGYRIVYEPRSIVYHKHSASTAEGSPLWRRYTERNAALMRYILTGCEDAQVIFDSLAKLNHLLGWYSENAPPDSAERRYAEIIPQIMEELPLLAGKIKNGGLPARKARRIGVYNPYWMTLGGGEAHALNIAEALATDGPVEIISESDFDLDEVCGFFGVSGTRFLKRIVAPMTPKITEDYDVFVNSCFQSVMPSLAATSLYVVSFPTRHATRSFVESYTFLANSRFTEGWIETFWREHHPRTSVLYPSVADAFFVSEAELRSKNRTILSVGRFATKGHRKSQIEIARAFKTSVSSGQIGPNWQLVLIGSSDDPAYTAQISEVLSGCSHRILIDAAFADVVEAYRRASVYVHASGMDVDSDADPELCEHFGIAVAQAAASGCALCVYDAGGPAEIVDMLDSGVKFRTGREMCDRLRDLTARFDRDGFDRAEGGRLIERARRFARSAIRRDLARELAASNPRAAP
ncbi:glycosyltransferase [Lichenibacterium dinghuense]|uniref:glycosyltransferase n=1 Tax=Lichenibacterium dinghuense TaxID=2895977 RepID=UPI001F218DD7|nr:glycosyltransferase [Lichenibacterium sp. 6Y81]